MFHIANALHSQVGVGVNKHLLLALPHHMRASVASVPAWCVHPILQPQPNPYPNPHPNPISPTGPTVHGGAAVAHPAPTQCLVLRAAVSPIKPALDSSHPPLQYTGERRWHIALPWLVGGIFMAVLPTVTDSGKHVSYSS